MKNKIVPNSKRYPEAWKIYIDCVRKWEEADEEKYQEGWRYGIPNPLKPTEYLFSDCPGKLFVKFKDLYYLEHGIRGFRNFLWKLEMMEGKISQKEYEANLNFMQRS
jgi:hypothetical protein